MTKKRIKIKLGRPLKYKTAEELENHVAGYFKYCQHERLVPGISGLASYLGITRKTLLNYENYSEDEAYSDVILRARTEIEAYNEQILYSRFTVGAQFILKNNFGYNAEQKHINENVDVPFEEYLKGCVSDNEY